ncbi:hypothetical protein Ddc_10812 [Ditylenchus destructor]|nr:hypothetical protein Ddc_10812 [Ditylenchus destructor]
MGSENIESHNALSTSQQQNQQRQFAAHQAQQQQATPSVFHSINQPPQQFAQYPIISNAAAAQQFAHGTSQNKISASVPTPLRQGTHISYPKLTNAQSKQNVQFPITNDDTRSSLCNNKTLSNLNNGSVVQQVPGTSAKAVELVQLDDDDEIDSTTAEQIIDKNDPYYYQQFVSSDKLEYLRKVDSRLDDDSLRVFLNLVRIVSGKKVIVVSSFYTKMNRKSNTWYDGELEGFEVALIPIYIEEIHHWVLGIYNRNEPNKIYYYDPYYEYFGIVCTHIKFLEKEIIIENWIPWVSDVMKFVVRNVMRNSQLNPEIVPIPRDVDCEPFGHCPKTKINSQTDAVSCGFHVALIAESYVMNNGEVFLEELDINAERLRIIDILSGLVDNTFKYKYRPKDVGHHLQTRQLDNGMNAVGNILNPPENAIVENKSIVVAEDDKEVREEIQRKMNQPTNSIVDSAILQWYESMKSIHENLTFERLKKKAMLVAETWDVDVEYIFNLLKAHGTYLSDMPNANVNPCVKETEEKKRGENRIESSHSTPNNTPARDPEMVISANSGDNENCRREKRRKAVAPVPTGDKGGRRKRKLCGVPSAGPIEEKSFNTTDNTQPTDMNQMDANEDTSLNITYEQLETNEPAITEMAAINYFQDYGILPKDGEIKCPNCGQGKFLDPRTDRPEQFKLKCENCKGLPNTVCWTLLKDKKKKISKILRLIYFWSRQTRRREITKRTGIVHSTIWGWYETIRNACTWYIYNRDPTKKIGGPNKHVEVAVMSWRYKTKPRVLVVVCRETGEKWMFEIKEYKDKDREGAIVAPLIKQKVHQDSTLITANFESRYLQHHFKEHRHVEDAVNADNPETKEIHKVWKGLMQADSDRSGTPPKQITGYIAEWLWFDEKCENADYFKEILKTLAEFWPPGAITHKSAVVNLHELIGTQACSNDSDTETEEEERDSDEENDD